MEITSGNIDNGIRSILNSDSATNTLSAVNGSLLVATNVPNVARATYGIWQESPTLPVYYIMQT